MRIIEIEKKFLVKGNFYPFVTYKQQIIQGYLMISLEKTVRIRIKGTTGFLNIKLKVGERRTTRIEYEYYIPMQEAKELLQLCSPNTIIEKERNIVPFRSHIFEVDVFHGKNEGLIIAELELKSEGEFVEYPKWLGREVTGDSLYYNVNLANRM